MTTSRGPNRSGPGRSSGSRRSAARGSSARPGSGGSAAGRRRTRDGSAGTRRPGGSRKPTGAPDREEVAEPTITSDSVSHGGQTGAAARRRASLTTRAIALAVVMLVLTISYASSLRVYFKQRQDLADTKQQIINAQSQIGTLSDEINRWNDPNYVRTQARDRLGWVVPGERGYRVVDQSGEPVTGETEIAAEQKQTTSKTAWYAKLWGSVATADNPAPAKQPDPANQAPITVNTKHR